MNEAKRTWGGARPGSGGKSGHRTTPISVKLDNDLMPFLKEQSNRNRFINNAIRAAKELQEQKNPPYSREPDGFEK